MPTQAQRDRLALAGGACFTVMPDADAPLSWPTDGLIITASGNLGLVMSDGSDNDAQLIPVTAGMYLTPLQAIALSPSNTAGVLGVGGIIAGDDGLTITGTPILLADKDLPYAGFTVASTGGLQPATFSIGSGALPPGITINPVSGQVSGTPTATGTSSDIVIRATDDAGRVASLAPFDLVVAATLTISGTPVTTATALSPYTGFTVSAGGGSGTNVFSVHAGALPTGIALDPDTGDVAGTPTLVETKTGIVIRVVDAAGDHADLAPFQIAVSA